MKSLKVAACVYSVESVTHEIIFQLRCSLTMQKGSRLVPNLHCKVAQKYVEFRDLYRDCVLLLRGAINAFTQHLQRYTLMLGPEVDAWA